MQKKNIHLGIHKGHNSAVCILDINNGAIIGNLEVERITRKKNDEEITLEIISEILDRYGIEASQVKSISTNFTTGLFNAKELDEPALDLVKKIDIDFFGNTIDCALVDHHASHAMCCAVSAHDFKSILILTSDGVGDYLNTCGFVISREAGRLEFIPIMRSYAYRPPFQHMVFDRERKL